MAGRGHPGRGSSNGKGGRFDGSKGKSASGRSNSTFQGRGATSKAPVKGAQQSANGGSTRPTVTPHDFEGGPHESFVGQDHPQFDSLVKTTYSGFVHDSPSELSKLHRGIHDEMKGAFDVMEEGGLFRADFTQPLGLGSKVASTFVTRCLVGDPGTTYKYLGLRMFSYPWCTPSGQSMQDAAGYPDGKVGAAISSVKRLNGTLTKRSNQLLAAPDQVKRRKSSGGNSADGGSANFTVSLINRMEPLSMRDDLKVEPMFGVDRCSVSWHADSSLENYSTIAVYHLIDDVPKNGTDWRVALRVERDAEGPNSGKKKEPASAKASNNKNNAKNNNGKGRGLQEVKKSPPIAVSLPSGSAYYMLWDFNHHNQHAVLSGDGGVRYSSTHRVGRVEGHTLDNLEERCKTIIQQGAHKRTVKQWRQEQALLSELEFEWLRQWYVQGSAHADLHAWWQEPIKRLEKQWIALEERTAQALNLLEEAAMALIESKTGGRGATVPGLPMDKKARQRRIKSSEAMFKLGGKVAYDIILAALQDREKKREGWTTRYRDKKYKRALPENKPLPVPLFSRISSPLPENLAPAIQRLKLLIDCYSGKSTNIPPPPYFPIVRSSQAHAEEEKASSSKEHKENSKKVPAKIVTNVTVNGSSTNEIDWSKVADIGLEVSSPWAQHLLNGTKKVDTRTYALPGALIGRPLHVIESNPSQSTGSGPIKSGLSDDVAAGASGLANIGTVTFSECFRYKGRKEWEADRSRHMVPFDSPFGWKALKKRADAAAKQASSSQNEVELYGWVVSSTSKHAAKAVPKMKRLHRSLFSLASAGHETHTNMHANNINGKKSKHKKKAHNTQDTIKHNDGEKNNSSVSLERSNLDVKTQNMNGEGHQNGSSSKKKRGRDTQHNAKNDSSVYSNGGDSINTSESVERTSSGVKKQKKRDHNTQDSIESDTSVHISKSSVSLERNNSNTKKQKMVSSVQNVYQNGNKRDRQVYEGGKGEAGRHGKKKKVRY